MAAAEPIRDKRELQKMANYWLKRGNIRNYTMIVLGFYTALRIVDILRLAMSNIAFSFFPNIQDFTCSNFTNFEQRAALPTAD